MKVKIEWVKLPRTIPENMGLEEFETDFLKVEIIRPDGSQELFEIRDATTFREGNTKGFKYNF